MCTYQPQALDLSQTCPLVTGEFDVSMYVHFSL